MVSVTGFESSPLLSRALLPLMNARHWIYCVLLIGGLIVEGLGTTEAAAQRADWREALNISASLSTTTASDDQLPFWLSSNQHGIFGREATSGVLGMAINLPPRRDRTFDISAGAEVIARGSARPTLYAHEFYGRLHAGPIRLTAGRTEYIQGIVDTTLSIGGTTWSRNAAPVPAVRAEIPSYVSVPGTRDFLAFRGTFAHGWFESDRFVSSPWLHEKQFYVRLLPERAPVQLHGGIIHNVMWGGTHPTAGKLESDFGAFRDVVFPTQLDAEDAEEFDAETAGSAVGNHVAAYDVALTAEIEDIGVRLYRQFYIETSGARKLRNVWDGLWGVNLFRTSGNGIVDRILYEHLRFVRQNAVWGAEGRRGEKGRAVYYNNFIYQSGWTHEGRVLGSPLALTKDDAPGFVVNEDARPIINNIIVANHVGIAGEIGGEWRYRGLLTYSRNHGMLRNPQPRTDQFAGLLRAHGPIWERPSLRLRVALSVDIGGVYPNRMGGRVGLLWTPN